MSLKDIKRQLANVLIAPKLEQVSRKIRIEIEIDRRSKSDTCYLRTFILLRPE